MRTFSKILSIISSIATIAVVIVAAVLVLPRLFGITPYVVQSGSMEPLINTGSIAYINTHDTAVQVGDVVTYRLVVKNIDALVTHRVVATTSDGNYITKGDANDVEDANPVNPTQIVGTYMFQLRNGGYVFDKIGNKKGIVVILIWLVLLNGISFAVSALAGKMETTITEPNKQNGQLPTT